MSKTHLAPTSTDFMSASSSALEYAMSALVTEPEMLDRSLFLVPEPCEGALASVTPLRPTAHETAAKIGGEPEDARACANFKSPEFFTDPRNRREFEQAQSVCTKRCPRVAQCLKEALDSGTEWGVWGGVWFVDGQPRLRFHRPRRAVLGI